MNGLISFIYFISTGWNKKKIMFPRMPVRAAYGVTVNKIIKRSAVLYFLRFILFFFSFTNFNYHRQKSINKNSLTMFNYILWQKCTIRCLGTVSTQFFVLVISLPNNVQEKYNKNNKKYLSYIVKSYYWNYHSI